MKLISNYHDYYDFFARDRNISDPTYVWTRKQSDVPVNFTLPDIVYSYQTNSNYTLKSMVVWFCGIPVPVVAVSNKLDSTVQFYYTVEAIPDNVVNKTVTASWCTYPKLKKFFNLEINSISFRDGRTRPKLDVLTMHRTVKSPVFCHQLNDYGISECINKPIVTINPQLSLIEFWQKFDSFSAFKMLEQFVSNQLAPRDDRMDKPISDVLKAQTHGFDKFSFRKEKQTD